MDDNYVWAFSIAKADKACYEIFRDVEG